MLNISNEWRKQNYNFRIVFVYIIAFLIPSSSLLYNSSSYIPFFVNVTILMKPKAERQDKTEYIKRKLINLIQKEMVESVACIRYST